MDKCNYKNCNQKPTHILVNYNHQILNNKVYCSAHAFLENRKKCPSCHSYYIEDTGLLPTYPDNTLDYEGCCCEHP